MEGDISSQIAMLQFKISIHALRVEGDDGHIQLYARTHRFLSTPSGWRATWDKSETYIDTEFLSTPSGWRATTHPVDVVVQKIISIHALRVEGDARLYRGVLISRISIHALRVEGDGRDMIQDLNKLQFLSTPSGWRATAFFFNGFSHVSVFLSTPSGWRATYHVVQVRLFYRISIHALRVEGDAARYACWIPTTTISIHALRVEGDCAGASPLRAQTCGFLSTPSGWRATTKEYRKIMGTLISIHALRVEGDKPLAFFRLYL